MRILVRGLGLAGTWATLECMRRGIAVTAFDADTHVSSSSVAAGLINPTTGSRPKPSWRRERLLPLAKRSYDDFSSLVNTNVWTDRKIRRVFLTEKDAQLWSSAVERGVGVEWQAIEDERDGVKFPFGGSEYGGATVDTRLFLAEAKQLFTDNGILAKADPTDEDFDHVIWCQGYQAATDPMWSWLPFQPVKGEIVDAEIGGHPLTSIYLRGVWIIPVAQNRVRIGATHDWANLNSETTELAREKLLAKAHAILDREMKVVDQQAAVRPAARSKRPYLGIHPRNERHVIINGLGAKGTLWAPWAAQSILDLLVDNIEVHDEVNILKWWEA